MKRKLKSIFKRVWCLVYSVWGASPLATVGIFARRIKVSKGEVPPNTIHYIPNTTSASLGLNLARSSPTSAGLGLLTKTKNTTDLPNISMLFAPIFSIPEMHQKWPTCCIQCKGCFRRMCGLGQKTKTGVGHRLEESMNVRRGKTRTGENNCCQRRSAPNTIH